MILFPKIAPSLSFVHPTEPVHHTTKGNSVKLMLFFSLRLSLSGIHIPTNMIQCVCVSVCVLYCNHPTRWPNRLLSGHYSSTAYKTAWNRFSSTDRFCSSFYCNCNSCALQREPQRSIEWWWVVGWVMGSGIEKWYKKCKCIGIDFSSSTKD